MTTGGVIAGYIPQAVCAGELPGAHCINMEAGSANTTVDSAYVWSDGAALGGIVRRFERSLFASNLLQLLSTNEAIARGTMVMSGQCSNAARQWWVCTQHTELHAVVLEVGMLGGKLCFAALSAGTLPLSVAFGPRF